MKPILTLAATSQVGTNYASCMRSHGVPKYPDPSSSNVHGFDPNSTQIDNKMNVCNRGLPPGIGVPLARPGHPG